MQPELKHIEAAQAAFAYLQRRGFPKDASIFAEVEKMLGWKVTLSQCAHALYPKLPRPHNYHDGAILMRHYHPRSRKEIGTSVVYTFSKAGTVAFTGAKRTRARYCEEGNNPIYFSLRKDWSAIPAGTTIYICESAIKAEVLCRLGQWAIGLNGIRGYGDGSGGIHTMLSLLPWQESALRACILFDSVSPENEANQRDIAESTQRIARHLQDVYGCEVGQITLPPPHSKEWANDKGCWGLDDFYECNGGDAVLDLLEQEVPVDTSEEAAQHRCTDLANAYRLKNKYGEDIRFCPAFGWLHWNGKIWDRDEAHVLRTAQHLSKLVSAEISVISAEAAQEVNVERRTQLNLTIRALSAWSIKCEGSSVIDNALKQLKPLVTVGVSKFEQHPWYFNCDNGTVDLRTGELLPHTREDYLLYHTPIRYMPHARSELWERTLLEIFSSDLELIAYKQRTVGYSMTGVVRDEVLFVDWGGGGNGKGVIKDTIAKVMGAYMVPGAKTLIAHSKNADLKGEYAHLFGKRMVVVSETEDHCTLSAASVKEITGNGRLTGKNLYKDYFSFDPTHKLHLDTNHKPRVDAQDDAVWRRLKLLHYRVQFADGGGKEGNTKLREELSTPENLEGVLAWLVAGCSEWQRIGLAVPPSVKKSTQDYRTSEDILLEFADEKCEFGEGKQILRSELYKMYKFWCADNSYIPKSNKNMIAAMSEKFELGTPVKVDGNYFIRGVTITPTRVEAKINGEVVPIKKAAGGG